MRWLRLSLRKKYVNKISAPRHTIFRKTLKTRNRQPNDMEHTLTILWFFRRKEDESAERLRNWIHFTGTWGDERRRKWRNENAELKFVMSIADTFSFGTHQRRRRANGLKQNTRNQILFPPHISIVSFEVVDVVAIELSTYANGVWIRQIFVRGFRIRFAMQIVLYFYERICLNWDERHRVAFRRQLGRKSENYAILNLHFHTTRSSSWLRARERACVRRERMDEMKK